MAVAAIEHLELDESGIARIVGHRTKVIQLVMDKMASDDPELLDRATELNRVMFSRDSDFLNEATRRQRARILFSGVVYSQLLQEQYHERIIG